MKKLLNDFSENDFIEELSPELKVLVKKLDSKGVPVEIIADQLAASPSTGLATKSAEKWDESLFKKILKELKEIICTQNEKYKELRESLEREAQITKNTIIAVVSGYVGKEINVATSICVPFVILSFVAILRAGLEVFCKEDIDKINMSSQND